MYLPILDVTVDPQEFTKFLALQFAVYFFLRGRLFPAIEKVVVWLTNPLVRYLQRVFKRNFLRTERQMALWLHYANVAIDKDHHHHSKLKKCEVGKCRFIL